MSATYTDAATTLTAVAVAKTKVYLGTTLSTASADSYIEIGGVMSIPDFGPSDSPVKIQTIGQDLEITRKGVTTLGGGTLEIVKDTTDTGQARLLTASQDKTGYDFNIRVISPDKATSTGLGTTRDIKCQVLSFQEVFGGPNNPIKIKVDLGINSRTTITAAT